VISKSTVYRRLKQLKSSNLAMFVGTKYFIYSKTTKDKNIVALSLVLGETLLRPIIPLFHLINATLSLLKYTKLTELLAHIKKKFYKYLPPPVPCRILTVAVAT